MHEGHLWCLQGAGLVKLGSDLRDALSFLRARVVRGPPRFVRACERQCNHLFTDPSLDGNGGGAAVQGLINVCAPIRNSGIILYVDNEAALGALIKCRSDSQVDSAMFRNLHDFGDSSGNCVWFETIPSKSNPADALRFECGMFPKSFRKKLNVRFHIAGTARRHCQRCKSVRQGDK